MAVAAISSMRFDYYKKVRRGLARLAAVCLGYLLGCLLVC
jgi:uncharacterized membrane protein YgaE (UPF0421/DUF939 family)